MASLVSEILMSAGQLEKRDLQTSIDKVNQAIEDAKFQAAKFLEQHYNDFNPLLVHSCELHETSSRLTEEVRQLCDKAETELKFQLDSSTNELTAIGSQIGAAKVQVQLLERVAELHTILESLKKRSLDDEGLVVYAQDVAKAEAILSRAEDGIDTELEVWSSVVFEVERYKDLLLNDLEEAWNANVVWNTSEKESEVVLTLSSADRLALTFQSLFFLNQLDRFLRDWSSRLLEKVLQPLMHADSSLSTSADGQQLQLAVGEEPVTQLDHLDCVMKNFSLLFQYLHTRFDFDLNGTGVMQLIGHQIADEFAQSFMKLCLKSTLPSSSTLLSSPEYVAVLERVNQFEHDLLSLSFLSDRLLGEFAANVDVFFADKICLESLIRARKLMCLDLHDTVQLGIDNIDQTLPEDDDRDNAETAHLWKMLSDAGMEIKGSPFRFPVCQISRSTQDLVELVTALVVEAGLPGASERCSARLLFTVRSVCELYISVVPEYHREELEKLPFHSAVAHNNGMFMAHSILKLGTGHLIRLAQPNSVPLMDLIGKFRQLAASLFLDHMKRQRDLLLQVLKDSSFSRLDGESRLPSSADKAVRQCLHQLRSLHKIWMPVLPLEVYLRAVGTLANACLEELLVRITTMEDIPSKAALQLADHCQTLTDTLPSLFAPLVDESETKPPAVTAADGVSHIVRYVHLWPKFQELRLLLGGGLRDIEDRWSSSKGPLAAHFTTDEVKQMIRALFQNTDQRAATLSRIK